jgi:hypothetical protein
LFVGPKVVDRWRGDRDVRADSSRYSARAAAPEFLEENGLIDVAGCSSTVFLVVLQAKQIQGTEALKQLARKLPFLLPLVNMRPDLFVDELADCGPKLLVLLPEQVGACRS